VDWQSIEHSASELLGNGTVSYCARTMRDKRWCRWPVGQATDSILCMVVQAWPSMTLLAPTPTLRRTPPTLTCAVSSKGGEPLSGLLVAALVHLRNLAG